MKESRFEKLDQDEHDYMKVGCIEVSLTGIMLRGLDANKRHVALGVRAEIMHEINARFTDRPLLDILRGLCGPVMMFRGLGTQFLLGEAVNYPEDPRAVAEVKSRFDQALDGAKNGDPKAMECLRDFEALGAEYEAFMKSKEKISQNKKPWFGFYEMKAPPSCSACELIFTPLVTIKLTPKKSRL